MFVESSGFAIKWLQLSPKQRPLQGTSDKGAAGITDVRTSLGIESLNRRWMLDNWGGPKMGVPPNHPLGGGGILGNLQLVLVFDMNQSSSQVQPNRSK